MARQKNIKSPDELWYLFKEYVNHEVLNPMYKVEYVGKEGEKVNTPLQVPITFEGFENYLEDLNIINDLGDYASNKNNSYSEYSTIITRIRRNCFVHNYKGAAVGLFNANLVARKLGITDKQDTTVTVKDYDISLKL